MKNFNAELKYEFSFEKYRLFVDLFEDFLEGEELNLITNIKILQKILLNAWKKVSVKINYYFNVENFQT